MIHDQGVFTLLSMRQLDLHDLVQLYKVNQNAGKELCPLQCEAKTTTIKTNKIEQYC